LDQLLVSSIVKGEQMVYNGAVTLASIFIIDSAD
jgi:hypothetical protein